MVTPNQLPRLRAVTFVVLVIAALVACDRQTPEGTPPLSVASPSADAVETASASPEAPQSSEPSAVTTPVPPVACKPTDQDRYVYNRDRLEVLAQCIRVTGTIEAVRLEADGDLHILLAVDARYIDRLTPANEGVELGDLVVEPVCVRPVTQADAVALCARDVHRLQGPFPTVDDHVWMDGRYVLDMEHGSWAELHPLYRWGRLSSSGGGISATPQPTSTRAGFYTPPGWDGHSDVDCADFDTHAHAQSFFIGTGGSRANDPYRLDGDHDGLACESLP